MAKIIKYRWLRIFAVMSFFFSSQFSIAQVENDLIDNRIELEIDVPFQSNTINCQVEKKCVNEAQTGKCIKYHNDQWFTITPKSGDTRYINISSQSCRDLRGVQLVVVDGVACDTTSYQIISCVSLVTQDDVFLVLESLEVGKEYLLNIDGYLHDFCDFIIEFSTTAKGLPMISSETNILTYSKENQYVNLNWEIDESMESNIVEYQIFRREAKKAKHTLIQSVSHEKNAFGIPKLAYNIQDTIRNNGRYYYKIVASLSVGSSIILDELDMKVVLENKLIPQIIELSLDYRKKTPITILVFNAQNNRLLKSHLFNFNDDYKTTSLSVTQWTKQNIHLFRIEIIDNNTHQKEILTFKR